jgi:DNA-binding PucR family transcriptional regulator
MYELRDSSASRASQLLKILKPMKARCGISETFDNLIHLDAYRFQAESALNLGREKHPEEWIYHYRDYFLPSLLNPRLMEFADSLYIPPAIRTLRDYDAEHHTELSATLEMYINELCRTSSTAQKLHIHRNSLLYRLQKIEEIANISLKDFHTVLLLGISYHLQKELMP